MAEDSNYVDDQNSKDNMSDENPSNLESTRKQKEKLKKSIKEVPTQTNQGAALAKDFSSFEMLWFDISTKVRTLFLELNQPLIDKIYVQSDKMDQIEKNNS